MLYKNQKEIIKKRKKVELVFLCTALRICARNMHIKFFKVYFRPLVTKLRPGQGNPDDAADAAAVDESNSHSLYVA